MNICASLLELGHKKYGSKCLILKEFIISGKCCCLLCIHRSALLQVDVGYAGLKTGAVGLSPLFPSTSY